MFKTFRIGVVALWILFAGVIVVDDYRVGRIGPSTILVIAFAGAIGGVGLGMGWLIHRFIERPTL